MKNNAELQKDVEDALKWEPMLNDAEIGVTVKDGIVTLTGTVDNFSKKMQAEDAAKNVVGVKVVVEKIEVRIITSWNKSDDEIAAEVVYALKWNWAIPNTKVIAIVKDGWVTLEGDLNWEYQRVAVKEAVANLLGVKGVINNTTLDPQYKDAIEAKEIKRALDRHWSLNARDIKVDVSGPKVTLNGTVKSMYQKSEASKIAWKAPGVGLVANDLVVEHDYSVVG